MRHFLNTGILFATTIAIAASGCATTHSGTSDEDQIRALLGQWKEAVLAAEADKLMATYSEDFAHDGYDYQAKDKAGLREFIDGAMEQGNFDDVELNMSYMAIEIEDGTATVYPIEYTIWEGTATIELTLTEEETGWFITGMDIEGM